MRKDIKKIKNEVEQKARQREYRYDEQERIIIPMIVQDDSDFLSVFAESETPLIGTDVAEYLEEKTENILSNKPIVLQVRSNCIDLKEQDAYREGVREYYLTKYLSNKKRMLRNNGLSILLAIAGMIALLISIFLDIRFESAFFAEAVDIVAWVFIWEAIDVFVFRNHEVRVERLRCLRFMAMDIEFKLLNDHKNE